MRIVPQIESEIRRTIRDLRAADPIINNTSIQVALEKKFGREFSYKYIARMVQKVYGETVAETDRTKVEKRLTQTREKFRIMSDRLLRIINWQAPDSIEVLPGENYKQYAKRVRGPSDRDVVEAVKTLGMLDLALLKTEIECGLYKDEETALAEHRTYTSLPEEQRKSIVSAFEKWGHLNKATVAKITERSVTLYAGDAASQS